ncbi:MAG: zinc ABC transporter substrate-binding protein, partial [Candidatus Electrothrix sp. AR1]|nr:zinc ABC transporter substrate-binding protein [Candidatus Electrothrix sp. AR1]
MQAKARTFFLSCLFLLSTAMFPANLPAKTEPLPVFVSIGPQKWIVEQLGGDFVSTQVLLDKGQEPHTYQPSPEKMTTLFRSRLYFTVGMQFEREIVRKIGNNESSGSGLQFIDVTTGIKKIPMVAHHHEESHEEHDEHRHEETEQPQEHADPHLWLDPRNVEKMASAMTEALVTADPEN